jgi:hypothetical protein
MLVDVRRLLSLVVIILLLQTVKNLIVIAQSSAIYVCDFIRALYIMDIHDLYRDSSKAFQSDAFSSFNAICELSQEYLRMRWFNDLNNGSEYLVFKRHHGMKAGAYLNAVCVDPSSGGNTVSVKSARAMWKMLMVQNRDNDILEGLAVTNPTQTQNPLFLSWRDWQL